MPKSAKHKRERAADFQKTKFKLGKGKQEATNATKTSFSSKAIGLPSQSISADKAGVPTTRRGQSIDDLLTNTKHYSANTRREALAGLNELLAAHPKISQSHLGGIVHGTARLIGDEDNSVRKAVRGLLTWLLPRIPPDSLGPFYSPFLFFTTSALSHIFPEIRVDATQIVNLFLDLAPLQVTSALTLGGASSAPVGTEEHGRRILTAYLGLLGAGEDSTTPGSSGFASSQLTSASKLVVLCSLSKFLAVATAFRDDQTFLRHTNVRATAWFFASIFDSHAQFAAFLALLPSSSHLPGQSRRYNAPVWHVEMFTPDLGDYTSHTFETFDAAFAPSCADPNLVAETEVSHNSATEMAQQSQAPTTALALAGRLNPLLVSTFLDAAPVAFAPSEEINSTSVVALETVHCVANIARDLWRVIASSGSLPSPHEGKPNAEAKGLAILLEKMAAYFVFGEDELCKRDSKSTQIMQDLNLAYCELVALLSIASTEANLSATTQTKLSTLSRGVGKYTGSLLRGEITSSSATAGLSLSPSAYCAILPTVWSLLSQPSSRDATMVGVLDHFARLSSASETKALSFDFLARLCLLEDLQGCDPTVRLSGFAPPTLQKLDEWFLSLPKYLWEVGNKTPPATAPLLFFLHRAASRPLLAFAPSLPALAPLLVPFFYIRRPRGDMPGPYAKLPRDLQKLARGMSTYVMDEIEGNIRDSLLSAVLAAEAAVAA